MCFRNLDCWWQGCFANEAMHSNENSHQPHVQFMLTAMSRGWDGLVAMLQMQFDKVRSL